MHISSKDFKKYVLYSLIFLWLILLSHLFYLYLRNQSKPVPVKGGVLLEGVVTNKIINPLPYIASNYYSKYVQTLLFKSCLNDLGETQLCNVKTKDKKTFFITLSGDYYWSDGRKITLDDIFFTYNDIIKNNSLNLKNPIPNTISKISKTSTGIVITFEENTVNNRSYFKYPILPKHILMGATKDYYVLDYIKNFVNSTCVKIDPISDFKTKIVLDYSKCNNVYFNKYQFNIVNSPLELKKYLSGNITIDIFNGYENIDPQNFSYHKILLSSRYALFWNVLKQTNPTIKTYLSSQIISNLKNNEVISNRLEFNGYGLFILPKVNLSKEDFKKELTKNLIEKAKLDFESKIQKVNKNYIIFSGENKNYLVNENKKISIYGSLLTGYAKIGIMANSGNIYFLKTYAPFSKKFKYVVSEKFKNIKIGKNTYTIYALSGNKTVKINSFNIFYKKITYPKFNVKIPDFTIVYLDKGFNSLLGDEITNIIKKIYPGKVISKKVDLKEYQNILNSKNYDLVIGNINFQGKDISSIFLSKNPIFNPSNFVNPNFANLIKLDLLSPIKEKKQIFSQLNKIYQQTIPVVILGNKKMGLYIEKKYKIPTLDYSYFTNRQKMLSNIVITYIKKPVLSNISFKGFINFLKENTK